MKHTLLALLCATGLTACHETVATDTGSSNNGGGIHIPSAAEISKGKEQHYAEQLPILQARNPEAEARASISQGKRYFLCNAGRGSSVPGVDPAVFASLTGNCPTECLDGVTDALYGENHRRYLAVALDYSAKWNKVMLDACR
ncbi:hypothetical protein RCF98_05250 [Thiothrix lacustris]|uniref:Lipoprotein n=1 Tax=Thiothrix lacustris TaxID=525917 RepID=A0ABY9MSV0_9GAMM|nr:hypothetical protein [Thiothrix lacustris]WML91744.1 hypothetical protein RCF98_05250 [Thiothrix lacustris]